MPVLFAASIALLAFLGVDSWRDWFEQKIPEFRQMIERRAEQKVEMKLRGEGILLDDGTVKVDAEFDAELNALNRETDGALSDLQHELDSLELEQ